MNRTKAPAKFAASMLVLAMLMAAAPPASKHAGRAEQALGKNKISVAVTSAEAAVAAEPRNAGYRILLGRVYLQAGRFQSAAQSFGDALALDPSRGGAALSLALAKIGLGDTNAARDVLERHGEQIAAGDRGLALALAGDVTEGIALLEAVVRGGASDARTRQNLALSYALAGRWPEAKLMASYDLDPATLAQRVMSWSRFTREGQASAQVAALLGVAPGADAGLPAMLALDSAPAPVQLAEAVPPPPPVPMAAADVQPAAPVATVIMSDSGIQFAPRTEIVQPVRMTAPAPAASIARVQHKAATFVTPSGGRFVVQLGAYDSMAVAEAAWQRLSARIGSLRDLVPATALTVRGGTTFHRLSLPGFQTRAAAASFCETLRSRGGQCFVRESAGDMPLQWARRGSSVRLAAR